MENQKILIIDDDVNICEIIGLYAQKEGYTISYAHDGTMGVEAFKEFSPDLVVLDIMLPRMDGWGVLREIRKISNAPVIMLSAKGETFDKVLGLELGADDYMVKPFDSKELIARIKAVLRRYEHKISGEEEITFPGLSINRRDYTVKVNGNVVDMPPKEFELLFFLASTPNKVFTREQLLAQIWDIDYFGDSRTVDVHVKRIREKIELEDVKWQLKTVWGVGYKFAND